jgi:lipoprotein-releasing system ATP-binding protein
MSDAVLRLVDLKRTYKTRAGDLDVLRGVNLAIMPGEIVGLVGPSGSGKSSLLHLAGLLEGPQGGQVLLQGEPTEGVSDAVRTALRRDRLGFIYQFHNLLPEFSALENVILPARIAGVSVAQATVLATALLEAVGLGARLTHRPAELSGGEQQRVAIARALINKPSLIIADEPTGNLDPVTSSTIFDLFRKVVREQGAAALVATHNVQLAAMMDRVVRMEGGVLVDVPQ